MGKTMLVKKFFMNTGIDITLKMIIWSYSGWRNKPHAITFPLQILQFS